MLSISVADTVPCRCHATASQLPQRIAVCRNVWHDLHQKVHRQSKVDAAAAAAASTGKGRCVHAAQFTSEKSGKQPMRTVRERANKKGGERRRQNV